MPVRQEGSAQTENLFRWPQYEFHDEDLVKSTNIGKSLTFDKQKAELEKKPQTKLNYRQELAEQSTFLLFCQNGNNEAMTKNQIMKGEPVMEYDCHGAQ